MLQTILKVLSIFILASSLHAGTNGGGNDGRLMNTAYFDVHTKSQPPILDYIKYSKRASFDIKQFTDTIVKIKEYGTTAYIHGRVIVPENITTKQVYINVGNTYNARYSGNLKTETFYNSSKTAQSADVFLVDTKTDNFGNRYVDYKIVMTIKTAWNILKDSDYKVTHPNAFFFSMAPKTRGFKNKFEKCDIYVLDE